MLKTLRDILIIISLLLRIAAQLALLDQQLVPLLTPSLPATSLIYASY
ncbi:hypothetical protein HX866_03315 [Pseudomonas gingeri]|nr:hypothetical protein [Pseudomonas gingeri]NWA23912.1 hypothetical protein [Pseudomonas gingeri]